MSFLVLHGFLVRRSVFVNFVIFTYCDTKSVFSLRPCVRFLLSNVRLAIRRGGSPLPYEERLLQLRRDVWTT